MSEVSLRLPVVEKICVSDKKSFIFLCAVELTTVQRRRISSPSCWTPAAGSVPTSTPTTPTNTWCCLVWLLFFPVINMHVGLCQRHFACVAYKLT
ncbi:hypothetical protein RUM43_009108 [Polyplax serrata]|uniref:Uncharacterized protein n=1 Tax=Polyplax serrata TaxID=468196 RepID=A0AAN8NZ93_POLSC